MIGKKVMWVGGVKRQIEKDGGGGERKGDVGRKRSINGAEISSIL